MRAFEANKQSEEVSGPDVGPRTTSASIRSKQAKRRSFWTGQQKKEYWAKRIQHRRSPWAGCRTPKSTRIKMKNRHHLRKVRLNRTIRSSPHIRITQNYEGRETTDHNSACICLPVRLHSNSHMLLHPATVGEPRSRDATNPAVGQLDASPHHHHVAVTTISSTQPPLRNRKCHSFTVCKK